MSINTPTNSQKLTGLQESDMIPSMRPKIEKTELSWDIITPSLQTTAGNTFERRSTCTVYRLTAYFTSATHITFQAHKKHHDRQDSATRHHHIAYCTTSTHAMDHLYLHLQIQPSPKVNGKRKQEPNHTHTYLTVTSHPIPTVSLLYIHVTSYN